ncbi:MAG: hypothetical protein QME90_02365 [Thermodesulfobacteriota bacterium]|nr:hypothetical protein [Thermodesulfobacteriota bacterium]
MEKTMGEEELKGLESEIDAAVDRLFVEKKAGSIKSSWMETPLSETFQETEKPFEWESSPQAPIPPSSPTPIEKLETQILSLEWEITKESLEKTMEEVVVFGKTLKETPDLSSVLNRMVMVLDHMIKNKESIQPHFIKFLLDSKETVKLLMRKEMEGDIGIYKKLAYSGIEARFFGLDGLKESKAKQYSFTAGRNEGRAGAPPIGSEKLERITREMDLLLKKMDEMMNKMTQRLSVHQRMMESHPEPFTGRKRMTVKVTVFKTGEKLFGVESDKVFRLFKVPDHLYRKFIQLPKIRINDLEAKIIDLRKFFPVSGEDQEGEKQILILKGDGEFKGLMIDRVLKRLSAPLDKSDETEEYLLGMVRWNDGGLPMEIPILDFKKF